MKRSRIPLLVLAVVLLAGCATRARPLALFRAQGDPPGKALALRLEAGLEDEKEGVSKISLSGGFLQSGVIRGEALREGELWHIKLSSLDWFSNWPNGWTQVSFLLDGGATLQPSGSLWLLTTQGEPLLDTVESATIRYFDTYLRDERGRVEFSRRWDRIQAVAKDLRERQPEVDFARDPRALRRYLFPEIYGYDTPPSPDHEKVVSQGFAWNGDYTREHFAPSLAVLRDSGTLLRDYKESPGLWLLALGWSAFLDGQDIVLEQQK